MNYDMKIRAVVESLAEYVETRAELSKALDEYDGYSPDYHLSGEFNDRDRAEQKVVNAIKDLFGKGFPDLHMDT